MGGARAAAKQTVLTALLLRKIRAGFHTIGIQSIMENFIIGSCLDLMNGTRSLELFCKTGFEEFELSRILLNKFRHGDKFVEAVALGSVCGWRLQIVYGPGAGPVASGALEEESW